jgi:hypothetical protein
MNSLEKFHFYCEHQQNKQMNEVLFDLQNPIFDAAYNHLQNINTQFHTMPADSSTIHITA